MVSQIMPKAVCLSPRNINLELLEDNMIEFKFQLWHPGDDLKQVTHCLASEALGKPRAAEPHL